MGALDDYAASAGCPGCGDVYLVSGQTKAFDPDFSDYHGRYFTPGKPQPLGYTPSDMLREPTWGDQWWRVRERSEPGRMALLVDLDSMFGCTCGRPLAPVLRFQLDDAARTVTLVEIVLLDALNDDVAAQVDLADGEQVVPWKGDYAVFTRDLQALATASPAARAQRLRQALAERFEGHERWLDPPDHETEGCTLLKGPMRCEGCGAVQERLLSMSLTHPHYETSALGDGWTGGVLRPGVRIASPMGWRAQDEDRGYFVRLRPSLPASTLTICGGPERWGCGCRAGWASVLARLEVDDEGFTLTSLSLRVLRAAADLDDVDFVYAPRFSRGRLQVAWRGWRPADRAEALACLHREWGLAE